MLFVVRTKIGKNFQYLSIFKTVTVKWFICNISRFKLSIKKSTFGYFFLIFLQKHIDNVHLKEINLVKSKYTSISQCMCKHSTSFKICKATKSITSEKITNMLDIHFKIRESRKYNFESCSIPINEKINVAYMRHC